jgi:hypothetical protein
MALRLGRSSVPPLALVPSPRRRPFPRSVSAFSASAARQEKKNGDAERQVTPPRLGRPRPVAWRCLLYSHSRLGAAAVWSEGDGVEERGSRDGRGCLPGWPRPHPCRVNGGQVVKPEPCASARPRTQSDGAQIQLRSHSSFQRGQNRASCAAGGAVSPCAPAQV